MTKKTCLLLLFSFATPCFAQFATTGSTTLSVAVAAEAAMSITTAAITTLAEASGAGIFGSPYTGITGFSYKIRTTQTGGSGSITVLIKSDFTPAGGPSVASPPVPSDQVTYTCSLPTSGTGCSGSVNASTTATSVATFVNDAHSTKGSSDAGTVTWTVPNDPIYKTGTYQSTALFTISAT